MAVVEYELEFRSPAYQAALGLSQKGEPNALFVERLTKYQQNLQQSVKQEQNKMVGQLGVVPDNLALQTG